MSTENVRSRRIPTLAVRAARFLGSPIGTLVAILTMAFGAFLIQPWGWGVAIVLVWLSPRWTLRTKIIVTAIFPATVLFCSFFPGISVGYAALFVLAAPFVSAVVLWLHAFAPHRARSTIHIQNQETTS